MESQFNLNYGKSTVKKWKFKNHPVSSYETRNWQTEWKMMNQLSLNEGSKLQTDWRMKQIKVFHKMKQGL